jgi:hypothetical protein
MAAFSCGFHGITDRPLMISYELAQELKAAGYPIKKHLITRYQRDIAVPTLEELIEACGDSVGLSRINATECNAWKKDFPTSDAPAVFHGSTPIEAVARLWLALHSK